MSGSPTNLDEPEPGPRAYRAFHLGQDSTVQRAEIIQAESDADAKAIAARLVNGHGIDLWERARRLATFPPLALR